jgi:hypothetical protein
MMNLLQVQDDLKNFSQDQLVKEMQQPSGTTPQFLVLSELNRRKRVKGDLEARQAQNQPTVAEEAVAAAGVPQQGMMGMPEAMAPQSAVSEGVGTSAPMKMASGGLMQFGNEIRNSMGQEIDPYLDGVQQEAEQKFNIDLNNNMGNIQTGIVPRPTIPMPAFPRPGYRGPPTQIGFGGKGMARPEPAVLRNGRDKYFTSARINEPFGTEARRFAEGGVIRAQDGLPDEESYLSKFGSYISEALNPDLETVMGRIEKRNPFGMLGALSSPATDATLDNEKEKEETIDAEGIDQGLNDAIINQTENKNQPKLNLTSGDENKTLSIEEELLKRQAGLDKSRNFDKYMALAQAGLGILASEKPTLAGAIGEGGMQGLDAFNAANKRYEEGITDILNARSKIQQARIAAGAKGKLTRSGAIQALNSFSTSISSKEKLISDIMKDSYNSPSEEQKNEIAALRESIKDLEFQKSQLFGEAKIRPRPSINVGKLPSTQKAS